MFSCSDLRKEDVSEHNGAMTYTEETSNQFVRR